MEAKLEKYYEERFNMMATEGWKDLVEDIQKMVDTYNNVLTVKSVEDLYIKQGQLDILNWIITLKDVSERSFEELKLEE